MSAPNAIAETHAPTKPKFFPRPAVVIAPRQSNRWEAELNKCVGSPVRVEAAVGPNLYEYSGILMAIDFSHLSVILATETDKIVIKNVATITRQRSFNDPPKETVPA